MSKTIHDQRVLFVCECCEKYIPDELPVRTRDEMAVMPDGTWLCDECYSECDKLEYGFPDPANRNEYYEHPEFKDLPRPPLVERQPQVAKLPAHPTDNASAAPSEEVKS